jgi:hypothetical protein
MDNVITLSECSCGVQRVRRAISRKISSWATSVLIEYSGEIDRTGLKILENNKNIQSIISVNTNILLRRFRLKFSRIMYSTDRDTEFRASFIYHFKKLRCKLPFIVNVTFKSQILKFIFWSRHSHVNQNRRKR